MGRSPSCWNCSKHEEGLNRGAWTASEDKILSEYIKTHGVDRWGSLPKKAGIKRCGKSCRLRWLNYLRPDIKRGNISPEEEELLIRLHRLLGNRWSLIAGRLPGRTDNEIKNYWKTHLSKRVQMGEFEPKLQKSFKGRDIPFYSIYDEEGVTDKDSYHSQTLPLKTKAVRYRGMGVVDGENLDSYNYRHVLDTNNGINQENGLKVADDHVVEIDISKSWDQLLLEDCLISTNYGPDHHESSSPPLTGSIVLQENHCSSYCNFFKQEFPESKDFNFSYFDSFLDLGELSIVPP